MFESLLFDVLVLFVYVTLSFFVGASAYDRTKKASAICGWAAFSMIATPILGYVIMWFACESSNHMDMKQREHDAKQKIEPAI